MAKVRVRVAFGKLLTRWLGYWRDGSGTGVEYVASSGQGFERAFSCACSGETLGRGVRLGGQTLRGAVRLVTFCVQVRVSVFSCECVGALSHFERLIFVWRERVRVRAKL